MLSADSTTGLAVHSCDFFDASKRELRRVQGPHRRPSSTSLRWPHAARTCPAPLLTGAVCFVHGNFFLIRAKAGTTMPKIGGQRILALTDEIDITFCWIPPGRQARDARRSDCPNVAKVKAALGRR